MPYKLRKRSGSSFWQVEITIGGRRIRRSSGTSDKERAAEKAVELELKERKRDRTRQQEVATFAHAVNMYIRNGGEERFTDPLVTHFLSTPLKDITAVDIKEAARALYPNKSHATWNRQVITPARAIINHAAESGLCPPIRVRQFPVAEVERVAIDADWIVSFGEVAPPKLGTLALFMFTTGARISQACDLTWSAVNLQAGKVIIPAAKGHDQRVATLVPELVAMLANLNNKRSKVFGYASRSSVYEPWKRACKKAGLQYVPPHQAGRHSFATEMIIRNGVDAKRTAELGGWKSVRLLLDTYTHVEKGPETILDVFGKKRR